MRHFLLALSLATVAFTTHAEEVVELQDLKDAPPPPSVVDSGETLEPEITIINKENKTIEEYRMNGNLYMVKVTPVVGPSYYLVDKDGDGELETNIDDIDSNFAVPQWVLFSW